MLLYIKLILMAVFWGGTFIAGRSVAQHIGPFTAAFLRFLVASICLLTLVRTRGNRLPLPGRRNWLPLVLLGLTGVFAYNVFFLKGLKLIEAGRAAAIVASNPVFIALSAVLVFRERLNLTQLIGVCLSVSGAIEVITKGNPATILTGGGLGWGELFIFCSVASWVAFSLVGKTVLDVFTPLQSITYSAIAGTVFLLPPALQEGMIAQWPYPMIVWVDVFYLGILGTVASFVWYYQGIQKIGPIKAGLFINFVPICGVLLAYLILDEPLTRSLMAGVALVSVGVYLTNRPSVRP